MRFLRGEHSADVVVAFLPGDLAAQMPTLSTDIRLGSEYAKKVWEKHHLGHDELGLIQTIVDNGWCTKTRPGSLEFLFVRDQGPHTHYLLAVKSARSGRETWIATIYRTNEQEVRRRLKKARKDGQLIRSHTW